MAKKIFGVYLAKLDAPNSEANARLELPASLWELHDAMDKVQLQENEELYLEVDDYYAFEYLAPHLVELDASLNELNDLAGQLAVLDETEQEVFDGLLRLEIQRKVESNAGILTMQNLRDLAVSAGADCCHVVGATSDAELGRFYAENGFMEELDGLSDDVFEMLDFGKIGKALRTGENGTFTRNGYVVQHSELVTAPPCAKEPPEKPEYLFRLIVMLILLIPRVKKSKNPGSIYPLYMASYGAFRFLDEFFRTSSTGMLFHLSHVWAAIAFAAGLSIYIEINARNHQRKKVIKK